MKTIRKRKKNKGFSLVEVLLAVALLGLVAAPILQLFYSSYAMTLKSKKSLAAADLSQTVLEYVSSSSMEDYQSISDPTRKRKGLKAYYIDPWVDSSLSKNWYVVPGTSLNAGSLSTTGAINTFPSNDCYVTYGNISYSGYNFDVKITFKKPETSGEYYTYPVDVEVRGYDSGVEFDSEEFFCKASTEVVNKY